MKRKMSTLLAALMVLALCLSGCGSKEAEPAVEPAPAEETEKPAETETPEDKEEPAASGDAAILVVSFGTSYNDSRDITIGAVEQAIGEAFPDYEVRRAFTAQIIIDKLAERDKLEIDNVTQALDRAAADGIKTLIVQPTHLMNGLEYGDLVDELGEYENDFDKIVLGEPLLSSDADFEKVMKAVTEASKEYAESEDTAIVFMGHGTEAESNQVYSTLQDKLTGAGFENYYIGTVEAAPALEDVMASLKENGTYKKVVLEPLMVVCGDHANNDMAGDEEDSWKTILEQEGYEVECVLKGLGELPEIQQLYVEHTQAAIDSL